MWSDAIALMEQAERLHRRFFRLLASPAHAPTWEPPVNVFRSPGELSIVVALPGVEAEHVGIDILEDGIEISAHAAAPAPPHPGCVERLEVPYGLMRRRINLPAGRYVMTERYLNHGCLYLRLTEVSR